MEFEHKNILVIGGPTGTGKSETAYNIAKKIGGEVISADSQQFYKELNIGTDKIPTYMNDVRHHMISFLSIRDDFNVYNFLRMAYEITEDILKRGKTPVITGGSGLYLRSLIKGMFDIPGGDKEHRDEINRDLNNQNTHQLYIQLSSVDKASALKIHPNDKKRIIRALEVFYLTGQAISDWHQEKPSLNIASLGKVSYFVISRERNILYERIEKRVEKMLDEGWIDEVKELVYKGYGGSIRKKGPVGYSEIMEYLDRACTLEELKAAIKKKTRNLAKKQITWFRKEDAKWLDIEDNGKAEDIMLGDLKILARE